MIARLVVIAALVSSLQASTAGGRLSFSDLQEFVYDLGDSASVEDGKVRLSGGRWTDSAGGGSTFSLLPIHAMGDLDGDRDADAAVILLEAATGTGSFYYLFAIGNEAGDAVQLGPPEWLGDRSKIERLTIDRKGILAVRYVTHADGDPACCPTQRIEDRYRIENGKMVGITR